MYEVFRTLHKNNKYFKNVIESIFVTTNEPIENRACRLTTHPRTIQHVIFNKKCTKVRVY